MRETQSDPYVELGRLISNAQSRLEKDINRLLGESSVRLNFQHWMVIEDLAASNGRAMGELQKSTAINDSTLTKVVDRLVTLNFAYRVPDVADRRKVLIHLSRIGQSFLQANRDKIAAAQKDVFAYIPQSEIEGISQLLRGS